MDELIRSTRESRRWKWISAVVIACAIGGTFGPKAIEAQQPQPRMRYTHQETNDTDLDGWLEKLNTDGWEVFQVVPVVHPPRAAAAGQPRFLIIGRRPAV
jgi:hypothetical protein